MITKEEIIALREVRRNTLKTYTKVVTKELVFSNSLENILETIRKTTIEINLLNYILEHE